MTRSKSRKRALGLNNQRRELRSKVIAVWELSALAIVIGASLMSPLFPVVRAANTDVNASFANGFVQPEVWIAVDDSVTWHNLDGFLHTIVSDTSAWLTFNLPASGQASHTFTAIGDNSYYCGIHPSMTGIVHVTATGVPEFPSMFFAVVGLLAMVLGLLFVRRFE